MTDFKTKYYADVSDKDWNDWRWQVRNKISTLAEIERVYTLSEDEREAILKVKKGVPFGLTPYYAGVVKDSAVRKGVIPSMSENREETLTVGDPLGEESHFVAPNLVHRYRDRVLFLVSNICPAYCRYCTRGRRVGKPDILCNSWEPALEYIAKHKEVRDILISGGEPLLLSDRRLDNLLSRLRAIKHVEIIRIGTKAPVSLPQRITPELTAILKRYNPVFLSIHFNHSDEISPKVKEACNFLADNGILLGSQTVLLKGINDNSDTLVDLMHELLKIRVKPYYLFQCDAVKGAEHFMVGLKKGIRIIDEMRSKTGGYSIPTYAVDLPNSTGKIAILPDRIKECEDGTILIKDFNGDTYPYSAV